MSLTEYVSYSLWLGGSVAQFVAAGVMLRRRQVKQFPMFFSYLAFQIFQAALLFLLHLQKHQHYGRYFYAFWTGQAIGAILRFGVIYEIFSAVFVPYPALRSLGGVLFRWSAVVLIMVAALVAASDASGNSGGQLIASIFILDRSINLVQCGLLFFLFIFSASFGLSWRHQVFGIAMGFGMIASSELAIAAIRTQIGGVADEVLFFVQRGLYDVSMLIWIGYLLLPEFQLKVLSPLPENDLETWNQELVRLLRR